MKISIKTLLFYSIFIAAFLPWINGFTSSIVPMYVFNSAFIFSAGLALALNPKLHIRAHLTSWLFLVAFVFALFMLFILHRIHPLAEFLVVVPVTLIYAILLRSSDVTSGELLRQLKWLYSFHVAFIVLELLMFYLGFADILSFLSGGRYRDLHFHFFRQALGLPGTGSPNSLLLQAQAASHLVLCALFLFYLTPHRKRDPVVLSILLLLFILFLLVITYTSLVVFVLLTLAVWMFKASLSKKASALLVITFVTLIFFDNVLQIFLFRFYDGGSWDHQLFEAYVWFFTIPITNIFDAHPWQVLFGHGLDTHALESGEIGFATLAFIAGVYLVVLLFAWLSTILVAGFIQYQRLQNDRDPTVAAWRSLLFLNIVLCAAWALSTAHYLVILIPGGLHLFAFSLAIVVTAIDRLGQSQRARARTEAPAKHLRHAYGDLSSG